MSNYQAKANTIATSITDTNILQVQTEQDIDIIAQIKYRQTKQTLLHHNQSMAHNLHGKFLTRGEFIAGEAISLPLK